MNEEILVECGLSVNEAKIYSVLLEQIDATPTTLAKKTRLHRTNVYDALKKLTERGIVSTYHKGDVKCYQAETPAPLLTELQRKQERLNNIMPQMLLAKQLSQAGGKAYFYEGTKSYYGLFEGLLQYNQPIVCFGIPKQSPDVLKHFIEGYHKRRIEKRIEMKHIYNFDAKERIAYLRTLPYTDARSLPQEFDSPVSTNICGPEVVILLYSEMAAVRIVSQQIADSYRKYFELLWQQAK